METDKIFCMGLDYANQWMNNPFAYLIFMMFANNFGWNNGRFGNCDGLADTQRQLATLLNTITDNHSNQLALDAIRGNQDAVRELAGIFNSDFNTMSQAICGIKSAIERVGGEIGFSAERVINAINLGNGNLANAVQSTACATQKAIMEGNYQNQINNLNLTNQLLTRIDQLANGVTQGFSASAYQSLAQTNQIIQSGKDNTQRIIDTLNTHWSQDLSNQLWQARLSLSLKELNEYLVANLKPAA